ncbi:MAG: methylmalonyl-CoA epimerase [Chloroflexia bacterium]|nr:methylmalonyl-CoA epimerase [Chloroflexia bacterium]
MAQPELHHIAVVVADLDDALARYHRLGFENGDRFTVADQAVEMAMLRSGTSWIELIRPLDPDGPIARYLAKRGEGMHHVAYAVPDLAAALEGLAAVGVRLIDTAPRTGAHGWRIAFIHPESCGGVLTELVQV